MSFSSLAHEEAQMPRHCYKPVPGLREGESPSTSAQFGQSLVPSSPITNHMLPAGQVVLANRNPLGSTLNMLSFTSSCPKAVGADLMVASRQPEGSQLPKTRTWSQSRITCPKSDTSRLARTSSSSPGGRYSSRPTTRPRIPTWPQWPPMSGPGTSSRGPP